MARSPLASAIYQADGSNYTAGRGGNPINHITVHHMGGVLSAQQCGAIFQRRGRRGSAHYGIGNGGEIASYVDESDRAWADSNWPSNCTTVSIETSNSSTGGDWPVGDAAYNSLCRLVADIAKRNGLGTLTAGKNLCWHSMYGSTDCPGPFLRARIADIAAKANAINGGSPAPAPAPAPAPQPSTGFLPAKGYWTLGDMDPRVGREAAFLRANFPAYTPRAALGNYYGRNLFGAVKEFQRRTGLVAGGSTGPITYRMLQKYGFKG